MKRHLVIVIIAVLFAAAAAAAIHPHPLAAPAPVLAQSGPVSACLALLADYVPVVGTDRYPTPADMPLPPLREAWLDPSFGACVIRATDRFNDFDTPQLGMKNEYSRVQSFNATESLIMVRSVEADWFLYDASTLTPLNQLVSDISIDEPRWDAVDPLRLTYSPWWDAEEPTMMAAELIPVDGKFDIDVVQTRVFTDDLPSEWNTAVIWRRWEGSPSADGRYDAFMAEDDDFVTRGLVTYDWQEDTIIGLYSVPHGDLNEPDSVSMSPLGTYVLAQFESCPEGTMGTYAEPCGAMIYPRDLSDGWGITRIIGHSDIALDADGREVIIYQEIDTDQIAMADLETGDVTPLLDLDYSQGSFGLHFSGQALNRPGWAAVSVHPEEYPLDFSNPFWMPGVIFVVELTDNPRVVQLAHHHSIRSEAEEDYFAEPQVTVNRDFTRLLFTSNWEVYGTGEVEMYMIVLPDDWLDRLP
ncbi:MAG: hypothetical protein JXJ20_02700 [Anaerolineae bacterium]|nr:hypothetical protein [Anaerolineae bacterium]